MGSLVNSFWGAGGVSPVGLWADISDASYVGAYSVSARETTPYDVWVKADGTKMYTLGNTGNGVDEWNLSPAWDVTSATWVAFASVSAQDSATQGITFSPDGLKMFYVGNTATDKVYQYSLSPAWDISSLSFVKSYSPSPLITALYGIRFSPDGKTMILLDSTPTTNEIRTASLSTAWDVGTVTNGELTMVDMTADYSLDDIWCFDIDSTGTKLLVCNNDHPTSNQIYSFTMSTPWDLTTLSDDSTPFDYTTNTTFAYGMFLDATGQHLYLVDDTSDNIREYDLP